VSPGRDNITRFQALAGKGVNPGASI
jgi:hypothetical protein